MGSWLSYGLGSESDDLPAFVVIPTPANFRPAGRSTGPTASCPRGIKGWSSAPEARRSTTCFPGQQGRARGRPGASSNSSQESNRRHLEAHQRGGRALGPDSRVRAGREDADLGPARHQPRRRAHRQPQSLYGVDRPETADFGRACLIARRLMERGVRFVQLLSGGTFSSPRRNWDGHENMKAEPRPGGPPDRQAGRRPAPRPPPPGDAR